MKRNILAFTCILLLHECVFAQQDRVLYFSAIINMPDAKPNDNNRSNITELNKIFDRNKVLYYETSLSSIRHPEKETKVEISCNNCDSESFIKELTAKGYFKDITYYEATPDYEPNDYMWYLGWLWHLNKIQAENAWDITKSNNEVIIAVIDSDFDINHPDLTNKINPHYDPETLLTHSAAGSSHGTATSSYAGAETDGGGQLASIGFNTRIIAYKIAIPLRQAYHATFSMNADIISFSFSGSSYTSARDREDIKEILDSGTIIVRSAGNLQTDSDNNRHPFADDVDQRIIIVSSTDINDNHTNPSNPAHTHANYPEIDLCAPGYCMMGAKPTVDTLGQPVSWPYYGCQTGTSFATPIVAGVCALMKSINPCLTPTEAQTIIKATADPITDAYLFPGLVGAGRINAYNSVKMAGTRNYSNTSLSGNQNLSAGYGFNLTNVTIGSNSNISLLARIEVNLNGTFEVPLGSSFSIEMGENVQSNCP